MTLVHVIAGKSIRNVVCKYNFDYNQGVLRIMKKEIRSHDFTRISTKMAKQFGRIPKGLEDEYSMLLYPIERNILKIGKT